jgi:hypothetical protein
MELGDEIVSSSPARLLGAPMTYYEIRSETELPCRVTTRQQSEDRRDRKLLIVGTAREPVENY